MFTWLRTLRGRLVGAVAFGVLCFLSALSFNQFQMRRIGAALQIVDTIYLPLARLTARMSAVLEPGDAGLPRALTEAREVTRLATDLRADAEERAALNAIGRQLDEIGAVATEPSSSRGALREEVLQLAQLVDGRIAVVSEKTAQAQGRADRISTGLLALSFLLGGCLLWLTGSALRPVTELTRQVRRVAAGDRAPPLVMPGNDEIAILARAFEQMTNAVQERDRNLQSLSLYLRRVLDSIASAVAVVEDGRVRMANPAASGLWGLREGDPLPTLLEDLTEGRHEGLPGGSGHQDVSVQPFGTSGRILVGEDVTDRRRDRERLHRSERLALVGQMLAQITHEVRNPLNAMSLHAELLAEEVHTDEERGLLQTIIAEIRRLEGVTERYLDLARRRPPEVAPEDPVLLARGVVALEEEAMRRAGVTAHVEGAPGTLAEFDGNTVRRALLNLLRNAGEAGAGHVEVRVTRESRAIELRVHDDGPGMESSVADRIFDPFFSTRARGTGLGLSITRQSVEDLGGTVRCETAPGAGTTFIVRIPC